MARAKILICDLIGLRFDAQGKPDFSEVKAHIESKGGVFHYGGQSADQPLEADKLHFFYLPDMSTADEISAMTADGQYDAAIAAATFIPENAKFHMGGVRIGAGTGNMGSSSWGGGSGEGGEAPLMNTPGINSRATAQMAFKALMRVRPDLPVRKLHDLVVSGNFDTGRQLRDYPAQKLEGRKIGIAGFGNIGRELALLAKAFGMRVAVYARNQHRARIEVEGFTYAASIEAAAAGADVFSVHLGLGSFDKQTGLYANQNLINDQVFSKLSRDAVLINYDRGELVDVDALGRAITSGQVGHAAIDADIFRDEATGALSGPMVPYLALAKKFNDRLELLPHAAADTDHPSRVTGAKQAIDQIFDAILHKRVTNLKGCLPKGYVNLGELNVLK